MKREELNVLDGAICSHGKEYYNKAKADSVMDAMAKDYESNRKLWEAENVSLKARIKELEASQPKWISVKDRLPTVDEGHFVVLYENGVPDIGWIGCSNCIETIRDLADTDVSHWMPLLELEKNLEEK